MTLMFPIRFLDPPQVFNANVINIPGSASNPIQVIADLGPKAAFAVDYMDTTGDFIGVYQGPMGQEVLKAIIGGGMTDRAWLVISAHSRISLRSMRSAPVTTGQLTCTFLGY